MLSRNAFKCALTLAILFLWIETQSRAAYSKNTSSLTNFHTIQITDSKCQSIYLKEPFFQFTNPQSSTCPEENPASRTWYMEQTDTAWTRRGRSDRTGNVWTRAATPGLRFMGEGCWTHHNTHHLTHPLLLAFPLTLLAWCGEERRREGQRVERRGEECEFVMWFVFCWIWVICIVFRVSLSLLFGCLYSVWAILFCIRKNYFKHC